MGQDGYRRKRDEKYDIDNIVIPYSIASTTRVEKIEYKEIITPSWRLLPNGYGKASGKNGICTNGWDEEIEDLSMEVIQARHERSEVEEHRKFNRNPKKSHRRSRRIDSKADYSDSNTPDPMSPNPEGSDNYLCSPGSHSPSIHGDRTEFSMLMPPSPATMLAPVVTEAVAALAVSALKMHSMGPGRRRTMSSTNSATSIDEDDDRRTTVVPWEKRSFPLSEDEYQRMRAEMPDEYIKLCDEDEMFWKEEVHS
jgi:KAT8 regulatory NSL complex subunit 1